MVLVITDRVELSLVYATTLGGVMIQKQSIRRNNMDEYRELLLTKIRNEGALSTFFRGEQYVFVCLPFDTYALNRMADYQEEYKELKSRPIPFIPAEFGYRVCDTQMEQQQKRLEKLYEAASSVVNAVSDSISGMLSFLHFQKAFNVNKPISRVRPNILSEEKVLEAFNAREDGAAERDFADACLLFERLNWLVNCNVSNAIMLATDGRTPMAAGRLEAVYLKAIECATDARRAPAYAMIRNSVTGMELRCTVASPPNVGSELPSRGRRCNIDVDACQRSVHPNICNAFTVLRRCGIEFQISPHAAVEALWRLFSKGYITWPSSSQSLPWSLKPTLTASVSQLGMQSYFAGQIAPVDIEGYCGWGKDGESGGRTATIVTAKVPGELSGVDAQVYKVIAEGIVQEFSPAQEMVIPVFSCGETVLTAMYPISSAMLKTGAWTILRTYGPAALPYKDWDLLNDVLPLFNGAFCEDFAHFLTPLDNLCAWGMVEKADDNGYRVTRRGYLLLKYISSTPLVNPRETIFWDVRMQRVADGKVSGSTVFSDVSGYINDLVAYVKVAVETMEATGGIPPSECVCPQCGADLEWDSDRKGWDCSSTGQKCNFFLPGVFRGHTLSVRDMAMLLTHRETDLAFDFESTRIGKFPARIVLSDRNEPTLSFSSRCVCPKCKQERLNEYQWGLACPDKRCGFTLNTNLKGVRLTEEDEIALFSGGKTRLIKEFISSKGQPFSARLYLDKDNKIKYDFPPR